MDNAELVTAWCRMWGQDPDLAHEVVAPSAQHWSGEAEAPVEVEGAEQQARRAAGRGDGQPVTVAPSVLVDGGEAVAFVWEATTPDSPVTRGLDVLALDGGLVARSWTFVATQGSELGEAPGPADGALDRAGLVDLARSWLAVWQGPAEPDQGVVTDGFFAWSGAGDADPDLRGPDALAAHVGRGRDARGAVSVEAHGDPVTDVGRQCVALLWTAREQAGDETTEVGGADLLAVRDGRVARSWTIRGARSFAS